MDTSKLPSRVQDYLDAIVRLASAERSDIQSVILFGSVATGGYSEATSDVDLLFVTAEDSSAAALRQDITRLETLHGFCDEAGRTAGALEVFVERLMANTLTFFVCTRADLLSGNIGRILGVRPAQAMFVDRIVLPSILSPAVTIWGEELLRQIPLLPIRRFDVFKAFFAVFCQVLTSVEAYPLLPRATQYAMGALKRSVHSCYFCYHGRPRALTEEVEFFQQRFGRSRTLDQLLSLRREYRKSFSFTIRCLPLLVLLHARTALENRFRSVSLQPGK